MSYDSKKIQYDKEHIYLVELELDYCSNTHGSAPCTATETGDSKCFNTFSTCNDLANYTTRSITTGERIITADISTGGFQRNSGNFIDDGFQVGHKFKVVGLVNEATVQSSLYLALYQTFYM